MTLTRVQRKQQTRDRLLEAAREVFLCHGYHAASLDQVAEQAGLTKGAVYSNFAGKDDLFLAVHARRVHERVQEVEAVGRDGGLEGIGRANARLLTARRAGEPEWGALLLEFTAYALRRPDVRRRFIKEHRKLIDAIAGSIDAAAARGANVLPLPARTLALAAVAIGTGCRSECELDPDGSPSNLTESAMALLFRGALASPTADPEGR